jgi:hypothetical protein
MNRTVIQAFATEFRRYRRYAEDAAGQLSFAQLRIALDAEVNSIAMVMKHLGGNLRSRWTDPFTTDGEKPWRDRDREFVDEFASRHELDDAWNAGWDALENVLGDLTDADLARELRIRGEPHSLALALTRSLSHAAYHTGQIVQCAKVIAARAGQPWKTLTIPRGGSSSYNRSLGFDPGTPGTTESPERPG